MYIIEKIIIVLMFLVSFASFFFIPKNKYREASASFLIMQLFAWLLGLLAVEAGLLEYPVRLFSKANATSISFEYLILPVMSIFFNLYYPENKSNYFKLFFYAVILSVFTFIELMVEKYTLILNYTGWHWYYTFLSMGLVFYAVRVIFKWFIRIENPFYL